MSCLACNQDRRLEFLDRSLESLTRQSGPPSAFHPVSPQTLERVCSQLDSLLGLMQQLQDGPLSRPMENAFPAIYDKWQGRVAEWHSFSADPSLYNLGGELKQIISDPARSHREKAGYLDTAMANAPDYYRFARLSLVKPDYTRFSLAVQKQILTLHFLDHELSDSLNEMPLEPPVKEKLLKLLPAARLAVKDYIGFCESSIWDYQDSLLRNQVIGARGKLDER